MDADTPTPQDPTTPPPPPPVGIQAALTGAAVAISGTVQDVIADVVTDGYLIGTQSAIALLTTADADWDDWTPGDPDAARRILGDNGMGEGLRAMLATSRVRLQGVLEDRFEEFARVLAAGVARGASVDELARDIERFLTDRRWAHMVAQQELARAISAATVDTFEDNGIEEHEWLVAGEDPAGRIRVCPKCQRNAAVGPVEVGEEFPTGDIHPPAHPGCRCALRPVIDLDDLADFMDDEEQSAPSVGFTEAGEPADPAWGALTEQDRNQLRDYWLDPKGGLPRWDGFRDLLGHLRKHVPDGFARRLAATIYRLRYGRWPGERNRKHREATAPPGFAWSVEEARYVRTPAGAKRYGLPVGSLIRPRRNRDGYFDDDQVAKRRAYYARARARAQQRHAARMAGRTADGHQIRKGDVLLLGDQPVHVRDLAAGKVSVTTGDGGRREVPGPDLRKGPHRDEATRGKVRLTRGEIAMAKRAFDDPDAYHPRNMADKWGAGYAAGELWVHDVPKSIDRIDELLYDAKGPDKRALNAMRKKLLALMDPKSEPKPDPKPDPRPKPTPDPTPGDDTTDGDRAEKTRAFRELAKGATATVEPGKRGKLTFTVRDRDGNVIGTRTTMNDYTAVRLTMAPDGGQPMLTFHRTPELAAKTPIPYWRGLPFHVVMVDDKNRKDDRDGGGQRGDATPGPDWNDSATIQALFDQVDNATTKADVGPDGKVTQTITLPDGTVLGAGTSDKPYTWARVTTMPGKAAPVVTFHRGNRGSATRGDASTRDGSAFKLVQLPQPDGRKADDDATPDPSPARDHAKEAAEREARVEKAIPQLREAHTEIGPGGVRDKLAELYPNATPRDLSLAQRQIIRSLSVPTKGGKVGDPEPERGARLAVRALDRQHSAGNHQAAVEEARGRIGDPRRFGFVDGPGERMDVGDDGLLTESARARLDAVRDAGAAVAAEIARRIADARGERDKLAAEWNRLIDEDSRMLARVEASVSAEWRKRFGASLPLALRARMRISPTDKLSPHEQDHYNLTARQVAVFDDLLNRYRAEFVERQARRERINHASDRLLAVEAATAVTEAEIRRQVLAEVRPMGRGAGEPVFRPTPVGTSKKRQAELRDMLAWSADDAFPTEWQEQALARHPYGVTAKSKRRRAYYSPAGNLIDVGTNPENDERIWRSVVTHEATHSYENTRPQLKQAEWLYLRDRITRTTPDSRGRRTDGLSTIYQGTSEKGLKDDFAVHYTGKVYGDQSHRMPFEILSTGFEQLLGGGREYTDPDMEHFALGVLALL